MSSSTRVAGFGFIEVICVEALEQFLGQYISYGSDSCIICIITGAISILKSLCLRVTAGGGSTARLHFVNVASCRTRARGLGIQINFFTICISKCATYIFFVAIRFGLLLYIYNARYMERNFDFCYHKNWFYGLS